MYIPDWINKYFEQADWKNKNGIIDKDEIVQARKNFSIFAAGVELEVGMDLQGMLRKNRSYFRKYIILGDKSYSSGRRVKMLGVMVPTFFVGRSKAKDDKNSVEVMQGQYSVNTYSKNTPSMQTYNIQNCIAVTIYDKTNKRGFMAHIDTTEKADNLEAVLSRLNFDTNNCEARIIGGRDNLSEGNVEIVDNILNKLNFNVVEIDVLGEKNRAIQMDLKTGEVKDYEEEYESTHKRERTDKDTYTPTLGRNKYSEC